MGGDDICAWSDAKAAVNLQKHQIAFSDLRDAFDGRFILTRQDVRRDYGEPRFNALVVVRGLIVNITFTPRGGRYHLISARVARRDERRIYAEAKDEG